MGALSLACVALASARLDLALGAQLRLLGLRALRMTTARGDYVRVPVSAVIDVVESFATFCADNNLDDTLSFDELSNAVAVLSEAAATAGETP